MHEWLRSRAQLTLIRTIAVVLIVLMAGAAIAGAMGPETSYPSPNAAANLCPPATPSGADGVGSPVAASPTIVSGSPESMAPCPDQGQPASFGTPISVADLSITISTNKMAAGPVTITVDVVGADGAPVEDAIVVLRARSLEMDMGTTTSDPVSFDDGGYVVERLPMGMGGAWQIEVEVARSGQPSVIAMFEVSLTGPA
jgi:hypothetical protein